MWPGGLLKGPLHGFAECEGCSETNEVLGLVSKNLFCSGCVRQVEGSYCIHEQWEGLPRRLQ